MEAAHAMYQGSAQCDGTGVQDASGRAPALCL